VLRWITERRVDGLIFARCTRHEEDLVKRARKTRMPMVFVAPDEHFGAGPVFSIRNRDAAFELARHLLGLGHRRFGFLGGPEDSVDTADRLRGLREGLATRSLRIDPAHIGYAGTYASSGAIAYARHWLELPRAEAPTAVVCGNDALAVGFMRTVLQQGVRVPQQVSVAGFDGVPESGLYWPGLTTVEQPSRAMGMAACRALLGMIEDGKATKEATGVVLPAELIVRESTGTAP
jgi:DNA-binding LacI/PurR family transcriptional regulator